MIVIGIEFKTEFDVVRFDELPGYVDKEALKKSAKLQHLIDLRRKIQEAIIAGNPDLVGGEWFMGDLSDSDPANTGAPKSQPKNKSKKG